MDDTDTLEFYYVTYLGPGAGGAIILPQKKVEGGGENPNGFNIAHATNHLFKIFGFPIVITNWKRTTRLRCEQFEDFIKTVTQGTPASGDQKRHLSLVRESQLAASPPPPPDTL